MGATIQFESHKVELPFIYELEHDEDVLEFYDQPPPIKLDYQGKNGRKLGVLHTPDFFVIRKSWAGWEECKTESELKKLAQKSPSRYVLSEQEQWQCPPGEYYACQFGLYYNLRSDSEINWCLQRNLVFLEDYLRAEKLTIESLVSAQIIQMISEQPGIKLSDLLNCSLKISADDIYTLITTENIYVNLKNALLAEPDKCSVFQDIQTARAYALMLNSSSSTDSICSPVINLAVEASLIWDGKTVTILHVGETEIILRSEESKLIELHRKELEALIQQGKISTLQSEDQKNIATEAWNDFQKASPEDQAEALRRYEIIVPYLQGRQREHEITSARTIRDWKAKYLAAQQKYGCGYLGLLSHRSAKGNRQRKLPEATLEIIDKFISEDYETLKQKKMWAVYCSLVDACEQKGIIAPSYKTFTKESHRSAKDISQMRCLP